MDQLLNHMLPDFCELADHCDLFLERGAFSYAQAEQILERAQSLGYGLKIHTNQMSQMGGIDLAKQFQLLSVEHLDTMSEEEIETLAESGAVAVLLPGASFFLREQWAPARKLIEQQIPIAIATDFNPGSSPCPNLHFVMNLAVHQLGMHPVEVWQAVTIAAAKALDKSEEIGSLTPGKYADLVLWDMPNYLHPFYYFGKNFVEKVWVGGGLVF
jgi:imidazolonepropionase